MTLTPTTNTSPLEAIHLERERLLKLRGALHEAAGHPAPVNLAHPGFSGCHDGPAAHSAQGEVAELVELLSGVADWQQHQCHADKVRRAAELLKGIPHA